MKSEGIKDLESKNGDIIMTIGGTEKKKKKKNKKKRSHENRDSNVSDSKTNDKKRVKFNPTLEQTRGNNLQHL